MLFLCNAIINSSKRQKYLLFIRIDTHDRIRK